MGLLKEAAKLLLKDKKNTVGVIKKVKGGVSAVTGFGPKVAKELSEAASAKRVSGWAKRIQQKLKD